MDEDSLARLEPLSPKDPGWIGTVWHIELARCILGASHGYFGIVTDTE